MQPMPYKSSDPLASTEWLLVDGTNLLHALSKSTVAAPRGALIGRLRGVVPPSVAIDVVFDGPSEPGLRGERIASGMRVRYSGGRTADDVLLGLVDETRATDGADGTAAILVVTDDRDLRYALQLKGARTARTSWLLGRLDRTTTRSTKPRPPAPPRPPGADDGDDDGRPALGTWPRRHRQEGQPAEGTPGRPRLSRLRC